MQQTIDRPTSRRRPGLPRTRGSHRAAATPAAPAPVRRPLPCRVEDPDLWFAESPAQLELAKSFCARLPGADACLAGALDRAEPWGVWGGEIFERGAVIARKRPRGRPRKVSRVSPDQPTRRTRGAGTGHSSRRNRHVPARARTGPQPDARAAGQAEAARAPVGSTWPAVRLAARARGPPRRPGQRRRLLTAPTRRPDPQAGTRQPRTEAGSGRSRCVRTQPCHVVLSGRTAARCRPRCGEPAQSGRAVPRSGWR